MISFVPPADVVDESSPEVGREWIVTNGIGKYASGTIAGAGLGASHQTGWMGLVATLLPRQKGT